MIKKLCALALAAALMLGLAAPTSAYSVSADGTTILPNEETRQFWEVNRASLDTQEIYPITSDSWNFCAGFHDGLLLIQESVTTPKDYLGGLYDNYLNKNAELVDLNRGRFDNMFSFSNGLAATYNYYVYKANSGVGYVDTTGKEVIPVHDGWFALRVDYTDYVGRFENGRALVLRYPGWSKEGDGVRPNTVDTNYDFTNWEGIEYAYIDTSGKVVTKWTKTTSVKEVTHLPLYDATGVWIGHRMDKSTWGTTTGTDTPQPEEEVPFVPTPHAPALPEYNKNAPSLFASQGRISGFYLGELDFGTVEVEITNPTDQLDAGVIGVALANIDGSDNGSGGMFFISYELEPHGTMKYDLDVLGILNQEMFTYKTTGSYAAQLGEHVGATVFQLKDDADLRALYTTVPYEQYWQPQNLVSEFQPVCDGQVGTDWLKNVAGITRKPPYLPSVPCYAKPYDVEPIFYSDKADHSHCEK